MRFNTKHFFVVSAVALMVGLTAVLAIPALGTEDGKIMTAPLSQSDQEMSLYKFYSEQIEQGVQLTKAEKEQYVQLESRYGASRHETTDNSPRGRQTLDEYIWTTATYDWVDLTGIGTNTGLTGDDQNLGPFALGFSFPFYGTSYTSIRVCSNGWLSFTSTVTTYWETAIPNTAEPNNVLYLFWDDMYLPDGGQILYYADTLNQRFIVSWLAVQHISGTEPYTYQAILYPSGNVVYQYQTIPTSTPSNTSCTVGIENSTGTQAVQVCFDGTGTPPTSGTALLIGQPDGVPNPVTNLAGNYVAPNVVLTWHDPTHDTNGNLVTIDNVQVWLGQAETGTLLATVNPGAQRYTHLNAPDGNLTYTIRPYLDPYFGGATSIPVVVGTPAYVSNFDANNGQWVATPATGAWEWGPPWGVAGLIPHSIPNVWGTVVSGNYANNACWQLDLDLGMAVTSAAATVEFWYWHNTQLTYDGCNFKASVDGGTTWSVLTPTTGAYPLAALAAGNTCMAGQPAWSGTTSNAWRYAIIPIGELTGQAPIFRFEFGSDATTNTYPGFYFDDMQIWGMSLQDSIPRPVTNLVGNYVAPNVVLTWTDPTQDTHNNPITIQNVQVWHGAAETGTLLATVNPGVQTYTHLSPPQGNNRYTVRPYLAPFFGASATVNIVVGAPTYDNDFNADNGMWVPTPETGGWSWGAPTNVLAPAPYSAPNYWGTGLTANYPNNACWQLDLNLGLVVQNIQATVEFWCWYSTETSYDGCNFKVSVDNGGTWTTVTPNGGYPVASLSTANTCNGGQPAWAGNSSGWRYVVLPIGQFVGQAPQFRFVFGSDPSVTGYAGFFFDDMIIWGLALPETTHVSGRVTLDGLGATVTNVNIASNGIGSPFTHPLADSTYSLGGVQVGNRTLLASLTGYISDTNAVAVPSGGLTNHNFLLRRVNPAAPTGLTGSVNTGTGVVTLNWDDSPDLQVDQYKIYRKLRVDQTWAFRNAVTGRTNSQGADTLTVGGIYQYRLTAADTNVIPPAAESAPSGQIELAYGALPPQMLTADTAFDNKIRLMWIDPVSTPVVTVEVYYDSVDVDPGCVTDGLGFNAQFPFAWFVCHYQGTGPITIHRVKTRHWPQSTPGCPVQMAVFEDAGTGVPTFTPLGVKDTVVTDPTGWLDVELTTPVTVNNGSFFVGIRQVTAQRVDIGMDECAAQHTNTFFYTTDATVAWATLESVGFPQVLVIRATVAGNMGALMELAPGPVQVTSWPVATVQDIAVKSRGGESKSVAMAVANSAPAPVSANLRAPAAGPLMRPASTVFRPGVRPYGTEHRGRSTLDDVIRYLVYRNTVRIDSVLATLLQYDNIVGSTNENVPYTYYVTARYDNGQESPPSNSITARCGMPPGAPTNLTLTRVGTTQMRIQWTNPTLNADGTPCVDYAGSKVYRDGALLTTVGVGVLQYTDTPPSPTTWYTWTVRGIDEVPNEGPGASASGVAGNASYENNFNTNNGGWVPDPATGGWTWGAPTNPSAPAPYSPPSYWGTGLTANYPNNACFKLTLSPGLVVQSPTARVEFWRWFNIESSWDGCNFFVSVDNGSTWQLVTPTTGGYTGTTNTANTCNPSQAAWTGIGTTWTYVVIPIGQFVGQTPLFRFVFGSDGSVTYPGFFFDDMLIWGLQPASAVTGVVRAFQTSLPIENAQVWAQGQPDTVTTDALGSYLLALEGGTYTLTFRHPHFCDTTYTGVVVETGSQTVRNAVMRAPHGEIEVTSLTMETPLGANTEETFTISNSGGQCPLSFAISDTSDWLTADPDGGTVAPNETATITVHATVTGMPQGDYVSAVLVTYNSVGSPADIRVDLHIGPSAVEPGTPLPTEFAYYQNYPNPFNAITALRFDVPQESRVEIAIFNIMGQEVARPVDEVFVPGRYRVLFNAGALPSGMYLVRMNAGGFAQVSKMMLLK